MTRKNPPRSLMRMLSASDSVPNSRRSASIPENWKGVVAGLKEAKRSYRDGRLEHAEKVLREVLEFAPAEAKAWAWLGKVLESMGKGAAAKDCLNRARILLVLESRRKNEHPASLRLARLLWDQGDRNAAREMLAMLLSRRPDDASLLALKREWEGQE